MSAEILTHELNTRRGPLLALTAALSILAFGALGAAAGLEDTITDLTEGFPEALMAFIPADVPGGYVVGEVFNLIAPLALTAYAVSTGAALLAGEEERGTMAVLSSMPVSRTSLLAWKAISLVLALAAVTAVYAGVALLAEAIFDIGLTTYGVAATGLHLLALATFFGAVTIAVGAWSGNPTIAMGAAGGLAALSYVTDAMLPLADLDSWARLSPWHYYAGNVPLANGVDLGNLAVLVGLAAIAAGAAVVGFNRRDLKG